MKFITSMLLLLSLALLSTASVAEGEIFYVDVETTKTVACDLPTTRTDGSALDASEIAEIRLFNTQDLSTQSSDYIDVQSGCSFIVDLTSFDLGQQYLRVKAVDRDGRISALSSGVDGILPFELRAGASPDAATGLRFE